MKAHLRVMLVLAGFTVSDPNAVAMTIDDVVAELPPPKNASDISPRLCNLPRVKWGCDMSISQSDIRRYSASSLPNVLAAWGRKHLAGAKSIAECPDVDVSILIGQLNLLVGKAPNIYWSPEALKLMFDAEDRAFARERARAPTEHRSNASPPPGSRKLAAPPSAGTGPAPFYDPLDELSRQQEAARQQWQHDDEMRRQEEAEFIRRQNEQIRLQNEQWEAEQRQRILPQY